jgi:hypothetical protein
MLGFGRCLNGERLLPQRVVVEALVDLGGTSFACRAPKRLRQLSIVCSLIPCRLATAATGSRSASRMIATICSSENRPFRVAGGSCRLMMPRSNLAGRLRMRRLGI